MAPASFLAGRGPALAAHADIDAGQGHGLERRVDRHVGHDHKTPSISLVELLPAGVRPAG